MFLHILIILIFKSIFWCLFRQSVMKKFLVFETPLTVFYHNTDISYSYSKNILNYYHTFFTEERLFSKQWLIVAINRPIRPSDHLPSQPNIFYLYSIFRIIWNLYLFIFITITSQYLTNFYIYTSFTNNYSTGGTLRSQITDFSVKKVFFTNGVSW